MNTKFSKKTNDKLAANYIDLFGQKHGYSAKKDVEGFIKDYQRIQETHFKRRELSVRKTASDRMRQKYLGQINELNLQMIKLREENERLKKYASFTPYFGNLV